MDITPQVPEGRQMIRAYDGSGFEISGTRYDSAVLVFPEMTVAWGYSGDVADMTPADLAPVFAAEVPVEVLLIGAGANFAMAGAGLREDLRARGIGLECMDTGAACRTYNVLMAEDRQVAAALLPAA